MPACMTTTDSGEADAMPRSTGLTTSRRRFLGGSTALALLPRLGYGATAAVSTASKVSNAAWRDLAAKLPGGVIRQGDRDFVQLSRPQNLRYASIMPLGIARPRDAAETTAAINWAREVGIPMVLRSGGHSYAGCSTVAGLIIHMGLMRGVRHLGGNAFECEGGALNSDIYRTLASTTAGLPDNGLTITHGRCDGVGASAFLLGGGIGFDMRDRGLGCDHVEEVEVALPDGRVVQASDRENAELFWALRGGGGGNLGAALRFKLRAHPAEPVTTFKLAWDKDVEAVFLRLVRALEAAPERMGSKVTVEAIRKNDRHSPTVALLGQLRGPQDEALAILAPALGAAPPSIRSIQTTSYWQGQTFLGVAGLPGRYQETSRYCGKFPEQAAVEVFRRCRAWPGTKAEASFKMFHMGGRIRSTAASDTAYVHRDAEWLTGTELNWSDRDPPAVVRANLAWQRDFHEACAALMPHGGSYLNFPDPGLADPSTAYYGANLARLIGVKRQVDPDRVFSPPRRQGIAA
jgi:FAD/FMN-containing dehydrogenase